MLLFLINFIRVVLSILIFYFVLRFISNLFSPKPKNNPYEKNTTEGETTIHQQKSKKSKKFDKNEGEYIDYEEIK